METMDASGLGDDQPIVMDAAPVRCRGEALDRVWWQGRQWAVTTFGIEARDGTYAIGADRLAEGTGHAWVHAWPAHVCAKNWVDRDDFRTAWLVAIVLHGAVVSPAQARAAVQASFFGDMT